MKTKLILTLLTVAAAFAQPPAPTELKAYLNLTDTQITSITTANRAAIDANRALVGQLHTKRQALETSLADGASDAPAIGRAMLEIQSLRKQLDAAMSNVHDQAVSFLTADQKTKLKALDDAAKLRPAIGQAHELHLLAPPANSYNNLKIR